MEKKKSGGRILVMSGRKESVQEAGMQEIGDVGVRSERYSCAFSKRTKQGFERVLVPCGHRLSDNTFR